MEMCWNNLVLYPESLLPCVHHRSVGWSGDSNATSLVCRWCVVCSRNRPQHLSHNFSQVLSILVCQWCLSNVFLQKCIVQRKSCCWSYWCIALTVHWRAGGCVSSGGERRVMVCYASVCLPHHGMLCRLWGLSLWGAQPRPYHLKERYCYKHINWNNLCIKRTYFMWMFWF